MKCYEVVKCSGKQREACYVWKNFHEKPEDMENIRCWVLKGAYQKDNKEFLKQCLNCGFYKMMNEEPGVVSDVDLDFATISCEGTVNNTRSAAMQRIWDNLKGHGKFKVILDLSKVNNVYSCGLGAIIQMHKDAAVNKGLLVVICGLGYVQTMFESTKLNRLLTLVRSMKEARERLDAFAKEQDVKAEEKKAAEKPASAETMSYCWEYWKNHNPNNATNCDQCFRKIKPGSKFCWLVEGAIEGVSFQYVNEDCEACTYYLKYGSMKQPQ